VEQKLPAQGGTGAAGAGFIVRILLLGASGFVGRHVGEAIRSDGLELAAPAHAELDATGPDAPRKALSVYGPDVVINAAAGTGIGAVEAREELAWRLNAEAPGRWAEACDEAGVTFVHFSTDQVFSGRQRTPYKEDDATGAVSLYGRTKEAGEKAVRAFPRHLVVRTSFVFGEDGANFMSKLPTLLMTSKTLDIVSDLRGSCAEVRMLARTTVDLVRREARGLFNVVNAGDATWPEFAAECTTALRRAGCEPLCRSPRLVTAESMKEQLGPRAPYSVLDTAKLTALQGRPPKHWTAEIPGFIERCLARHSFCS
jgi:dTDP-4-dehydrorhamnose reductase